MDCPCCRIIIFIYEQDSEGAVESLLGAEWWNAGWKINLKFSMLGTDEEMSVG